MSSSLVARVVNSPLSPCACLFVLTQVISHPHLPNTGLMSHQPTSPPQKKTLKGCRDQVCCKDADIQPAHRRRVAICNSESQGHRLPRRPAYLMLSLLLLPLPPLFELHCRSRNPAAPATAAAGSWQSAFCAAGVRLWVDATLCLRSTPLLALPAVASAVPPAHATPA
jgi:hypothetical protein